MNLKYLEAEVYNYSHNPFKRCYMRSFLFGKNAIYCLRKYLHITTQKSKINFLTQRVYRARLISRYGMFVGMNCKIGEGICLPHPQGIIIGSNVTIGKNATIYQQVTIGGQNVGDSKNKRMPQIGDNVILFAGCKVLGDIKIANGTIVAAGAVLCRDTVENGVYAGVPARLIKRRDLNESGA